MLSIRTKCYPSGLVSYFNTGNLSDLLRAFGDICKSLSTDQPEEKDRYAYPPFTDARRTMTEQISVRSSSGLFMTIVTYILAVNVYLYLTFRNQVPRAC